MPRRRAPEDGLAELEAGLAPHLPVAVMLLGMGADMHTASIFPGADRLEEALTGDAPLLVAMRAPGAPEPRVTLTASRHRGRRCTAISSSSAPTSAHALERRAVLPPEEAPVAAVLADATVHWAER